MTFTCGGKVTEWEFWADNKGTFFASVWRVGEFNTFKLIGKNKVEADKIGLQVFVRVKLHGSYALSIHDQKQLLLTVSTRYKPEIVTSFSSSCNT